MAGSFGFEQDKLELSQALGERVLLPAVRAAGPDEMCWPMASPVVSRSHRASTIASPDILPRSYRLLYGGPRTPRASLSAATQRR